MKVTLLIAVGYISSPQIYFFRPVFKEFVGIQHEPTMALTLADFKKITNEKEEEAKRVREEERKVDKAERAAERAQHIEAISKIIETSVKDEVRRSVKPVQE